MKKLALILAITFAVSGCSQNYLAEREYHKAKEIRKTVSGEDVEVQGVEALTPVIEAYERVFQKHPGTGKALESMFIVANLYVQQKKYDKARYALSDVVTNFSRNAPRAAEARFAIAQTYLAEGDWGQSESMLWETAEYNPLEEHGLKAPLSVLKYYNDQKFLDAAKRVYKKAVEHYERLIQEVGPIQASIKPRHYLALAHASMGDWNSARAEWDDVYNDFSKTEGISRTLFSAAEASVKLGEHDKALEYYTLYITNHPHEITPGSFAVQVGMYALSKESFDLARSWFKRALDGFANQDNQKADVKILIGRAFQSEGNWEEAKKWYDEVLDMHTESLAGLQAPLYIADYYKSKNNTVKMDEVLNSAIIRYNKIIEEFSEELIAQLAFQFKTEAYKRQGEWDQVISEYDRAIEMSKDMSKKAQYTFLKAAVVDSKMNDKDKALILYTDFLTNYPGHPQADFVKKRVEILAQK